MSCNRIGALILSLSFACSAVFAADSGPSTPMPPKDPALEQARSAIARQDWTAAQSILREAIGRDPSKADYHNLYAYAMRKGPSPDMDLVFREYQKALELDPRHRGAYEYLGEAYLTVGNVAKAKEQLAKLDKLCFFPCEEYSDLKKAIAGFEKSAAAK